MGKDWEADPIGALGEASDQESNEEGEELSAEEERRILWIASAVGWTIVAVILGYVIWIGGLGEWIWELISGPVPEGRG